MHDTDISSAPSDLGVKQEPHNMAMKNTNNDKDHDHLNEKSLAEIPPTVDPDRPPQRNDDNATCPCGVCPCRPGSTVDGGGGRLGTEIAQNERGQEEPPSKASSEAGDLIHDEDEEAQDHLIEVGDFGYISIALIHRTLAKHARCTCHNGILPLSDNYPFSSPGDSMLVELSSGGLSRVSSEFFMHDSFDREALMQHLPLLFNPLQLTADVEYEYSMEMSISSASERDWSVAVSVEDLREYDMW